MAHLRTLFLSVGSFYFSFVIIIIMNDLCIYLCRLHCKAAVVAINCIVMTREMGPKSHTEGEVAEKDAQNGFLFGPNSWKRV